MAGFWPHFRLEITLSIAVILTLEHRNVFNISEPMPKWCVILVPVHWQDSIPSVSQRNSMACAAVSVFSYLSAKSW